MKKKVGVIGAGNFGTAISMLLSKNTEVLLYSRQSEVVENINRYHRHLSNELSDNIIGIGDIEKICTTCDILFIAVPSKEFLNLLKSCNTFLTPRHIVIHCIKGFEIRKGPAHLYEISRFENLPIRTMSEVLQRETNVVRIGCLSGPNLSSEILRGLPAATVIASSYDEVIKVGKELLNQPNFKVFGSHHLKGTEIAGALKNIIAIASGLVNGQKLGKNLEAIILTKGIREVLVIGKSLDILPNAFLGLAGIGDLIATATSKQSRNYYFGFQIGESKNIDHVISQNEDLIEGVTTTEIIYNYCIKMGLDCPIVQMVYDVIFNKIEVEKAVSNIYESNADDDVDFML